MTAARLVLVTLVLAAPSLARARGKPKSWEDILPPRLGAAEHAPTGMLSVGRVTGAYWIPGPGGDMRSLQIVIELGPHPVDVAEAIVVHKPGERRETQDGLCEGLRPDGRFVQRVCDTGGTKCRVDAILANRVWLQLIVERPTDRGEPLRFLKLLDLKGIEALARREKLEPLGSKRNADSDNAKLAEVFTGVDVDSTPQMSIADVVDANRPPPPQVDSLSPEVISKTLAARNDIRLCHDPARPGGKITVSFTVNPNGQKVVDRKIEATTIADQGVQDCVLQQLGLGNFPRARQPTKAKHTFVFPWPTPRPADQSAP